MLPQQVIKGMQGLADDSFGSHNVHTKSQLCKAKVNQDFLQTALFKATEKACGETRVERRLTTGSGKSWLKPNICRLTQTPTSDTEAQWSSQARCWARHRLRTQVQQCTPGRITMAVPQHLYWSSPAGESRCNTAGTTCHHLSVTAWHFPQINTCTTTWSCYKGRATIL